MDVSSKLSEIFSLLEAERWSDVDLFTVSADA